MKYLMFFLIISISALACQKSNKTVVVSKPAISCAVPDEKSFFPLVSGSVWYYADYIAGERDPSSVTKDTIIDVRHKDSETFATVARYGQGGVDTLYYSVNAKGEVLKYINLSEEPDSFALLYPRCGKKVGRMTYDGYCAPKASNPEDCFRLEEYPYDSATTQIAKMKWQFMYFMRGIGLVSNGGDELVTKLEKYKIGNQEMREYR